MESDDFAEQSRDKSAFDWMPVSSDNCRLEPERYHDSHKNFVYPKKFS